MGSKPKQPPPSDAEVEATKNNARQLVNTENALASIVPVQQELAHFDRRNVHLGKANADVNQAIGLTPLRADPSRGGATGSLDDMNIGRSAAVNQEISSRSAAIMDSQDRLKANVIASGTKTLAATNSGLSSLGSLKANNAIQKLQRKTQRNAFMFDAAAQAVQAGGEMYAYHKGKDAGTSAEDAAALRRANPWQVKRTNPGLEWRSNKHGVA